LCIGNVNTSHLTSWTLGADFLVKGAVGTGKTLVLLYLPRMLLPNPSLSDEAAERLHRNLIYVALTRALDMVVCLLPQKTTSRSLVALKECFRKLEAEGEGDE